MLRDPTDEQRIDTWGLVDADWRLVANKTGATRLGVRADAMSHDD